MCVSCNTCASVCFAVADHAAVAIGKEGKGNHEEREGGKEGTADEVARTRERDKDRRGWKERR